MGKIFFLSFLILSGSKLFSQSCDGADPGNDLNKDRVCAPATYTWRVWYNSVDNNGFDVYIQIDWGDNTIELLPAMNTSGSRWEVQNSHVYPQKGDYCNYTAVATLFVAGIECTSSRQQQNITVWDTDDWNGGEMQIYPDIFPICVGNADSVTFTDVSLWNCTPPEENDVINNKNRWVQWIYGTAGNIYNAQIGGTIRPWPYTGAINYIPAPVEGPVTPYNTSLPIYIPDYYNVGDYFQITLRNWNACNPYDDPTKPGPPSDTINGDYMPVTTTAIAIIVAYPDATITPIAPMCDNEPSITLTSATNGGDWSGSGITNTLTGLFDPKTAGAGTHIIEYSVTNSSGCTGTDTVTIIVNPSPKANINVDSITYLCPGILQNLNGNPTGGTLPYINHSWTGDTSPLSYTDIPNPAFQTTNIDIYNLNYRVIDSKGCSDNTDIVIEVDTVNIYFERPFVNICANVPTVIDPGPTGGSGVFTLHQWSGDSIHLLSADNIENPIMTASIPGIYIFYYYVQSNQGCDASDSVIVQVREVPVVDAGFNDHTCGLTYTLDASVSIGNSEWMQISGSSHSTFANINDPKTFVQVDSFGVYNYQCKADNFGCADSATVFITYNKTPVPKVMNDIAICSLQSNLHAKRDIGTGIWSIISSPTGSNPLIHNYLNDSTILSSDMPGIYHFTWTENNNGCIGSDTTQIQLYPVPIAQIDTIEPKGCNIYTIAFNNISSNADSYIWDFGDSFISTQKNPVHTFENNTQTPKNYLIKMVASNIYNCRDTFIFDIEVSPSPDARFIPDKSIGCTPLNVNFINQSLGATTYKWNFCDKQGSSTEESPYYQYINNEVYVQACEVQLVAENDYQCTDTARSYITIFPSLNINFTTDPIEGCTPLKVNMIADPGGYSYKWDFGDGTLMDASLSTSHIYELQNNTQNEYNVTLLTESIFGCTDTSTTKILVNPSPKASFQIDNTDGCSPHTAQFINTSVDVSQSTWIFNNQDKIEMPNNGNTSYSYINNTFAPQWKNVRLVVENSFGCVDSTEHNLQIYPEVGAAIALVEPGCSPLMTIIQNETTGGRTFEWDYGDGNTSTGYMGNNLFEYYGDTQKNFNIRMIATSVYGCKDTAWTIASVYPSPKADFTPDPESQKMPLSTFTFNNNTSGNGWNYSWNFGDGSTSTETNPTYEYGKSGTFNVTLNVSGNMCTDSITKSIYIAPMPPQINYGPNAEGCPPLTVEFYNNTIDAQKYIWEFGDNERSELKNPVHIFHTPGEYTVKLTAIGDSHQTSANNVKITVYETPVASFSYTPKVVVIPSDPVKFNDESIGNVVSWYWNFGDSIISTDQNPEHTYSKEGTYDVTLKVINDKGCPNEFTQSEAVKAKPAGELKYPNAFTPNTSGPNGGYYGDPETRQGNHVFYPFYQEGVLEYKLQIFTRWGELIFESQDVKIGWDGYLKGRLCEQGVYIYKATVKFSNGSTNVFTGDVTLIR